MQEIDDVLWHDPKALLSLYGGWPWAGQRSQPIAEAPIGWLWRAKDAIPCRSQPVATPEMVGSWVIIGAGAMVT